MQAAAELLAADPNAFAAKRSPKSSSKANAASFEGLKDGTALDGAAGIQSQAEV